MENIFCHKHFFMKRTLQVIAKNPKMWIHLTPLVELRRMDFKKLLRDNSGDGPQRFCEKTFSVGIFSFILHFVRL